MIRIVTDTASDMTREQARSMDVTILSLPVTFGETPYIQLDDEHFTLFYDLLEHSKVLPVTSLTSPGEYLEIFEDAKKNRDSVVVIPISSQLSGSWRSACLAKEMADYEDIHIIDGLQVIIGQRLLVEHAVKLRQDGYSARDIAEKVLSLSKRIHVYGALHTLKYLIKGGRISKSAGAVGSVLQIKPVVSLQGGSVVMAGKARGWDGALALLLQNIGKYPDFDPSFPFCFGYTKSKEPLDAFAALTKDTFKLSQSVAYPIGGVIGTHIGPNAIAAVWVVKE